MDVRINQLQNLMYRYVTKSKPLFVHGTMGIGKSATVRQVAERVAKEKGKKYLEGVLDEKAYCLIDIRVSQLDPSDLRGIPFPEGKTTRWLIPSWLPTKGEGIILFDELNLAPPSIQASCYQLILDRRLGDYVLPDGWTIIAAGNRAIDKANVFPMAAPLKNRFSHAQLVVPSEEEWRDWAMDNGINTDVIAFMAFKPSMLFKFNATSKDNAFPTPRMWAVASEMIDGVKSIDEQFELVATCVGEGAAHEYRGFVKLKNKVNVADILKNPEKVTQLKEVGLKYSLVSGLAEKYKSDRKLLDKILLVIDHMDAEFGVFLLRLMKGMNSSAFVKDLMNSKHWKNLYNRFNKYLT